MILAQLRVLLLGCLLAVVGTARPEASGEEGFTDSGDIEKTFIVDIARAAELRKDIGALNKFIAGKGKLEAVDMPDIGVSIVTGTFSESEIEELRSRGYEEPDPFVVNLFDGATCEGPELLGISPTADVVPPSVCRVVGSPQPVASGSPTVWIIDSGVDWSVVTAGLLKVQEAIDCTSSPCQTVSSLDDTVGHGTMVAAVIGGKRVKQGDQYIGLVGVSPDAPLKIVKAFSKLKTEIFGPPLLALRHVRDNAVAGDILNLSWGALYLESTRRGSTLQDLKFLDALLYQIADRQVRVVVAAGNPREDEEGPWVQSYFPANAATYFSPVTTGNKVGAIYSASASNSEYIQVATPGKCQGISNAWCDTLWRGGAFGASYAEPGVNVLSLWKSRKNGKLRRNICSGTSFAAPALAGLLVRNAQPTNKALTTGSLSPNTDLLGYMTAGTPVNPSSDEPKCN